MFISLPLHVEYLHRSGWGICKKQFSRWYIGSCQTSLICENVPRTKIRFIKTIITIIITIMPTHCFKMFPSCLGRRTTNFAATPDESRGKFAGAYNPPIRNILDSKILSLSRNKLVISAVKNVCFPHVFPRYSSAIIDNFAFYRAP